MYEAKKMVISNLCPFLIVITKYEQYIRLVIYFYVAAF